ncbi:MAG: flagellar hook-associated protein FlgK, partial [Lachnospiraceae bacterium]|nr:flagellar hook-associated protein FlgK [Lachnospiraceae bacterium]
MSLFSGLYVGASGLVTNQNALNTTAHNLSNIGTLGYTRQQVVQSNKNYDTIGQAYISSKQVGLGVQYADVRSVRDYFLDKAYRTESGRSEYYTTGYNAISEMETLFGEM